MNGKTTRKALPPAPTRKALPPANAHTPCGRCGMCSEELQGRKFCPDCP